MQWFYANESDQQVAFEEENFEALVEGGSIKKDTLVWNEVLPDWKPCLDVRPELFGIVPPSATTNPTNLDQPPPLPSPTGNAENIDGIAVTSLVFGILSIFLVPLTGFVAVICGHVSRKKWIERTGSTQGGGVGLAGLILGYIGITMGIALTLFVMILAIIGGMSTT